MEIATKREPEPKIITIAIELDGENFVYRPALLHANPKDKITWRCNAGDFTVSFPERSPFDRVTIHGSKDEATGPDPIRNNVEPGVYHYHVAVAVPTGEKVKDRPVAKILLDSGCPGIEVP